MAAVPSLLAREIVHTVIYPQTLSFEEEPWRHILPCTNTDLLEYLVEDAVNQTKLAAKLFIVAILGNFYHCS